MARKKSPTLTDGELRIMESLWALESASVRQVTEHLAAKDPLAYNTVQTMLGILEEKGYVQHGKEGRAFVYSPIVSQQSARSSALKHLMQRFFDGSPEVLMQNLLTDEAIDIDELERLKQQIDEAE